jgi:hypothetical protein
MNTSVLDRNYKTLTPGERFRLLLAAAGRGDEVERERLVRSGKRITLTMPDHSPHAHAFSELAFLTFIELVEDAAHYNEAWLRFCETDFWEKREEDETADTEMEEEVTTRAVKAKRTPVPAGKRPLWQRSLELAYADGFMLRTKADGWKLFCERLHIPPFLVWQELPGFERLQEALAQTEKTAFNAEGMLCWLNTVRQKGEPVTTLVLKTVVDIADEAEQAYRKRVAWWGG